MVTTKSVGTLRSDGSWRAVVLALTALASFVVLAESRIVSSPTLVCLRAAETYLWSTLPSNEFDLHVIYPEGATSVVLEVRGARFSRDFAETSAERFHVVLPVADSPQSENVYTFTLRGNNGAVRTARLGLVDRGADRSASSASARLLGRENEDWGRVVRSAVLPVPYGASVLTVNGAQVDTELGGAAGWFCLTKPNLAATGATTLAVSAGGVDYSGEVWREPPGLGVFVK